MRVAVCQLDTDLTSSLSDRVSRAGAVVRDQAGADLVVLPELWPSGAFSLAEMEHAAQPIDGEVVTGMRRAARDAGVWLQAGSFVEQAADGRRHNTALLIDPDGEVRATYRKLHLFGLQSSSGGETSLLDAGDEVVTCETPFGVIGLATCYDLRFPELFRRLVDAGATTVLLPSAWPDRRRAHWQVLTRARAIENQVVVVACNAVGTQGKVRLAGRSVVLDAWGESLAEGGDAVETLDVDVDPAGPGAVRETFPVLGDRRLSLPTPRSPTT